MVAKAGFMLDGYNEKTNKHGGLKPGPTSEPSPREKDSSKIKLMCVGGRREGGSREPE